MIITRYTDVDSCYAKYEDNQFRDISDLFPVQTDQPFFGRRALYIVGDCNNNTRYLAPEDDTDELIKFNSKEDKTEQILLSQITDGQIQGAIISAIKTNGNDWLFQFLHSNKEKSDLQITIVQYDSISKKSKEIFKTESSLLKQSVLIIGWDSKFSAWVVLTSKCNLKSQDDKKECQLTINHLREGGLAQLPIELPPVSSKLPTIVISSGDYFISYDDKLYEVRLVE